MTALRYVKNPLLKDKDEAERKITTSQCDQIIYLLGRGENEGYVAKKFGMCKTCMRGVIDDYMRARAR
jgi:ribosomal protein S14